MTRYIPFLLAYLVFYIAGMLLAPLLPILATKREGPTNNNGSQAVEPRLPIWLSWFDTSHDNSLWGDDGWRTKHCHKYWNGYIGMVLWLWRNPACGFCWSVLSFEIKPDEFFHLSHSGNYLEVDKGSGHYGWYFIRSSSGAFSLRWCKKVGRKVLSFEAGWLLDVYLKDYSARSLINRAPFQFQPQIKTAKA